jgi:hypothetical protein
VSLEFVSLSFESVSLSLETVLSSNSQAFVVVGVLTRWQGGWLVSYPVTCISPYHI